MQLDDDIQRYGLGDRVYVLGAVSDERIGELYAAADLFVLPSRFEGYGMVYCRGDHARLACGGNNRRRDF